MPTIVRWPGRVPAGTVSDLVWYFADFLATAAEIAGLEPPDGIDGASILPALLGDDPGIGERFLYWGGTPGNAEAVRWGRWKAVRESPGEPLELFDLSGDAGEKTDVGADNPEIVAEILGYIDSAVTELPKPE